MNSIEVIGVITGAISVWLAARQNWLTWPIGIINLVMFVVMFMHERLYADVLLHVCYLGLSVYGWMQWGVKNELRVTRIRGCHWAWTILVGALIMGVVTQHLGSAYAFLDSLVASMSLAACYLMSRKVLESWIIYLISDIIAICIYLAKGLDLTAALYLLYLLLCIKGYQSWRKELTCA